MTRISPLHSAQVTSNVTAPRLCLDMLQRNEDSPYNLGVYACHNYVAASQVDVTLCSPSPITFPVTPCLGSQGFHGMGMFQCTA